MRHRGYQARNPSLFDSWFLSCNLGLATLLKWLGDEALPLKVVQLGSHLLDLTFYKHNNDDYSNTMLITINNIYLFCFISCPFKVINTFLFVIQMRIKFITH